MTAAQPASFSAGIVSAQANEYFLGLETSSNSTGVALLDATGLRFAVRRSGLNHNEVLLELVSLACRCTGIETSQLNGIGVTIGPGMFSSLRVGLSVAKGLALPWQIPVKGIETLRAIARTAAAVDLPITSDIGATAYLALTDARKQQVYCGLFTREKTLLAPCVAAPKELPGIISPLKLPLSQLVLCGEAAPLCFPLLHKSGIAAIISPVTHPEAQVVAEAAKEAILREGGDNLEKLVPVYLRRTDAELNRIPD